MDFLIEDGTEWSLPDGVSDVLVERGIAFRCGAGEPNTETGECGKNILHLHAEHESLTNAEIDQIIKEATCSED